MGRAEWGSPRWKRERISGLRVGMTCSLGTGVSEANKKYLAPSSLKKVRVCPRFRLLQMFTFDKQAVNNGWSARKRYPRVGYMPSLYSVLDSSFF